ncbi:hypothetical protein [Aliagarivorans taiwanensis]|uniref:hypothetical protein n=1 Tax=Aliagarivorans taiwanensis TaxID=561966 RepID=UPI00040B47F7|nr:hypothetical protein [Aliagarivorans taiwanensis]
MKRNTETTPQGHLSLFRRQPLSRAFTAGLILAVINGCGTQQEQPDSPALVFSGEMRVDQPLTVSLDCDDCMAEFEWAIERDGELLPWLVESGPQASSTVIPKAQDYGARYRVSAKLVPSTEPLADDAQPIVLETERQPRQVSQLLALHKGFAALTSDGRLLHSEDEANKHQWPLGFPAPSQRFHTLLGDGYGFVALSGDSQAIVRGGFIEEQHKTALGRVERVIAEIKLSGGEYLAGGGFTLLDDKHQFTTANRRSLDDQGVLSKQEHAALTQVQSVHDFLLLWFEDGSFRVDLEDADLEPQTVLAPTTTREAYNQAVRERFELIALLSGSPIELLGDLSRFELDEAQFQAEMNAQKTSAERKAAADWLAKHNTLAILAEYQPKQLLAQGSEPMALVDHSGGVLLLWSSMCGPNEDAPCHWSQADAVAIEERRSNTLLVQHNDGSLTVIPTRLDGMQTRYPWPGKVAVSDVALVGEDSLLARSEDGLVHVWAAAGSRRVENPEFAQVFREPVAQFSANLCHGFGIDSLGSLQIWTHQRCDHTVVLPDSHQHDVDRVISHPDNHEFAILKRDGTAIIWGQSQESWGLIVPRKQISSRQPSDSIELPTTTPCHTFSGVRDIVANQHGFLLLKQDGSLVAWGQLGSGIDIAEQVEQIHMNDQILSQSWGG